jgi:hypothetical protein
MALPNPPKPGKPDGRPKPERADDLTPEERKHLDEVLSQAWQDPAVITAREEVHAATDKYRKALRDAVERIDASAVPLMGKLHDKSRVEAMRRKLPMGGPPGMGPMGPPLPKDPAASIHVLATQEANLRHLEGADRERFLNLARQLQEAGTLNPQIEQTYEAWTRGGRDAAKSRRELREQFVIEMRKLDPWAAQLLQADLLPPPKAGDKGPEGPPP